MIVEAYQTQLLALLPHGPAWARDRDGGLAKLMAGIAEEFARIDARADAIFEQSLPSQVAELIDEWEADYGLPDESTASATTLQERRTALIQKYQQYGSQSREFLIAMAAALGFPITITEYAENTFGGDFGDYFWSADWAFVVQINFDTLSIETAAIERMEGVIRKILHSHKVLLTRHTHTNYLSVDGSVITYNGEPVGFTYTVNGPLEVPA